jgi:uncharacterized membrane protein
MREFLAWLATPIIALIVGLILFAVALRGSEDSCKARGGWFTMIGGYPSCLPPGGKP